MKEQNTQPLTPKLLNELEITIDAYRKVMNIDAPLGAVNAISVEDHTTPKESKYATHSHRGPSVGRSDNHLTNRMAHIKDVPAVHITTGASLFRALPVVESLVKMANEAGISTSLDRFEHTPVNREKTNEFLTILLEGPGVTPEKLAEFNARIQNATQERLETIAVEAFVNKEFDKAQRGRFAGNQEPVDGGKYMADLRKNISSNPTLVRMIAKDYLEEMKLRNGQGKEIRI